MNANMKRLLFTILLVGTVLSVFAVTTVTASTNGITYGEHQRDQDRVQDCDACENQNGPMGPHSCSGTAVMSQLRHRYQYRHCKNQGN